MFLILDKIFFGVIKLLMGWCYMCYMFMFGKFVFLGGWVDLVDLCIKMVVFYYLDVEV